MKSLALLLFSILLNISAFAQNGVYLFGYMENAPGTTFDISVVVYTSPPVTTQFTVNPDGDITNGSGNWVNLPTPDWTHFEVLYPTCNNETNILTVLADSLPNMIDVFYTIDYCPGGGNDILGCTDPYAINYDPNATLDNGTCFYNENTGCVDVNLDVFCVDTLSNAYDLTIADDPFCCETSWDQLCQQNYEAFGGQPIPECDEGEEDILGCTDPNAVNYNPEANLNDGSCVFADSCDATVAQILIATDQWGQEISWNLYYEGVEIAGDGNYQNNSTYSYVLCLEDGCFTFEMHDSFGDGWNGGSFSVLANGGVIASGTLNSGNFGFVDFGINTTGCDSSNYVFGCTDPNAINYDPNATLDDGTCEYVSDVENDLCADATDLQPGTQLISNIGAINNENIWGECWAFGNGEGEQSSIWYSFTTPNEPATIHIEASPDGTNTLTDTQFGLFEECGGEMIYCDGNAGQGLFSAFTFACGELETNTTYILMIDGYFGDMGTCYLTYDVETGCVPGCTDPEALNYDPNATSDDGSCIYDDSCTDNEVTLLFSNLTNNYGYWQLFHNNGGFIDIGEYDGVTDEWNVCLGDGCYVLVVNAYSTDSIFDNGTLSVIHNNQIIEMGPLSNELNYFSFGINANCDSTDVHGCTDPEAFNYDPNATVNDGTCEYECGDLSFEFVPYGNPPIGCVGQMVATYTGTDQSGTLVWDYGAGTPPLTSNDMTGFYQYSENGEYIVCATYYTENCTLQYCDTLVTYGCNGEIYGCTNPAAVNYDPNADTDDGSCVYADSCDANFVHVQINTMYWGNEISWSLLNGNTVVASGDGYVNDSSYDQWVCLDDGCYTFEMYDSWGDGWNGGEYIVMLEGSVLSTGTLSNGTFGSATFGINADCEDDIFGCTDPAANNYNPEATIDDGSCQYDEDCVEVGDEYCVDETSAAYEITILQDAFCCNSMWDQICQNAYIEFGGPVGEDCDIYGCTDPNANNYNPNATIEDGSCEYEFDCAISFTVSPDTTGAQVIWIAPSDNIYNAVSVEWDFGDGNSSTDLFPVHTYEGDGPYMLCLTATFEDNGGFCEITYCAELTNEMINPPGMQTEGFSINVVDPLGTTGVEEIEWISELSLWPNPATDVVQVEFALHENTDVKLELYDAIGQMIYHSHAPSHSGTNLTSIDVGDLKPGMYFLRLNGNNEQMTTRLVVQ